MTEPKIASTKVYTAPPRSKRYIPKEDSRSADSVETGKSSHVVSAQTKTPATS